MTGLAAYRCTTFSSLSRALVLLAAMAAAVVLLPPDLQSNLHSISPIMGAAAVALRTSARERAALVALYQASGAAWTSSNGGWEDYTDVNSDPCASAWEGVLCSPLGEVM